MLRLGLIGPWDISITAGIGMIHVSDTYNTYSWKLQPQGSKWGKKFSKLYSSLPLIGTPFLPNNSVLIREVSFGEREHHMHVRYLLPRFCVLSRGVSSQESVL